ncbi:MAG: hypothetical protein RIQ93_75 [Verrucomicrobiota bacterium]|jgi:transmembrane sensor
MKRPEPDSPAARDRAQTAADWLARHDRGLTATEQDDFLQWLAADPRHGDWFALHRSVVADFTALAQWRPEHSEEPNPDLLAPPRRPRIWRLAPLALAAAAVVAVAFIWWRAAPPAAAIASADPERHILEDGSAVEMNRGAVVTTAFTSIARHATLVRGEAYFTVAKDAARPFVVRAGSVDVRAIGTAFSVRLDSTAVEVLVAEGTVAVSSPDIAGMAANAVSGNPSTAIRIPTAKLIAGQRATVSLVSAAPPSVTTVTPAQIARHLTWQPQLLDFSSAPLAVAVAEFNRRNSVQFVLADAELGALPIVASIRSDNVEGFTKFLAAAPGLYVERRSATMIVVHRKR